MIFEIATRGISIYVRAEKNNFQIAASPDFYFDGIGNDGRPRQID
jgi:hypothetical protein